MPRVTQEFALGTKPDGNIVLVPIGRVLFAEQTFGGTIVMLEGGGLITVQETLEELFGSVPTTPEEVRTDSGGVAPQS